MITELTAVTKDMTEERQAEKIDRSSSGVNEQRRFSGKEA